MFTMAGCCKKASFAATAADMVKLLLVADVRPDPDAVRVNEPVFVNTRLENVATPLTAATESVDPALKVPVEVIITVEVFVVTVLPFPS